jgi:YihY family inner membrane protein
VTVRGQVKVAVKRLRAAMKRYRWSVWDRDRAALDGWAALGTRVARIATWSVRGVFTRRLSTEAAALAYYTIFSIVPVLVIVLWALKLFHAIPYLTPAVGNGSVIADATADVRSPNANVLLRQAVRAVLTAVDRAGAVQTGLAGLVALTYALARLVIHVEAALDSIAGARDRPARYRRMLGYLALLALPPVLLVVSGVLRLIARLPLGENVADWIAWLADRAPLLRSTMGNVLALGLLCLALAIFYTSAARARIAFRSAIVGAAVSAVLLGLVLWVFARLQIGVSRAGALQSGMAAIPVFLLWAHSSWLVILLGAQIAIAHELDGILIHGTSALSLDPYGEQVAGLQIMVETTRRALSSPSDAPSDDARAGTATANELARDLRLLPDNVREMAERLQAAGLLRQAESGVYHLSCDPDETGLRDVVGAIIGGQADKPALASRRPGPSLHELVERRSTANGK